MRKQNRLFSLERSGKRDQIVIRLPMPSWHYDPVAFREGVSYLSALTLLSVGLVSLVLSLSSNPTTVSTPQYSLIAKDTEQVVVDSLPRSLPTHLTIADIGVSTDLIELGKNDDGTMQTPDDFAIAGWYKHSPTPGEIGPSIIVGHVDNYLGPAVFFRLKELQQGQLIRIARDDGRTATFSVDKVETLDQNNFPTEAVYGNIDHAGIRLITCGGTYDVLSGRYSHNIVVYGSLVHS